MLSIILPAYNEEQMIPITVRTLAETMGTEIPYELVFIDDGSRDKTWDVICAQAQEDPHILGIHFSRNFGKEAAMFAGLAKATGDCCVVMDCDLQHPPEKVVEMYHLWQQGYEVVEGVKEDRGRESAAHRFAAKSFYKLISDAAGMDMSHSSDFKLLDRKVWTRSTRCRNGMCFSVPCPTGSAIEKRPSPTVCRSGRSANPSGRRGG